MIRGETPSPARHASAPGDRRCDSALARIAALLEQHRSLADEPSLREHLSVCEDCNSHYRNSLLADARLRRKFLELAQADVAGGESSPRRAVLSPFSIARASFVSSAATGRGKATWVLVLAVIFYAVVRLTPDPAGSAHARLESLAGDVISVGPPLAAGAPERELRRGDWVRVPEGARAQLHFGQTRVELASSTQVQVEEPSTRRLRLETGSLEVFGPLLVTCAIGLVEVESGHARLHLDQHGLRVESIEGSVQTIDALGEHEISPGASARLALAP